MDGHIMVLKKAYQGLGDNNKTIEINQLIRDSWKYVDIYIDNSRIR